MPRYFGEGLKYFQIDTDFHDNDKIDILRDHFDDAAVSFWIFLHGRIFDNGYYIEINERFVEKFCKKILRKTPDEFYKMLELCLTIKVFDRNCYNNYQILTSRGIQTRYLFMGKRWERIKLIEEFMLDTVNYEDSTITIYNLKGQHIGYKKKQGELIKAEFPSRSHLKKVAQENGISSQNSNTNTESIKKEPTVIPNDFEKTAGDAIIRDRELEEMAATFFHYNETSDVEKVKQFSRFLTSLNFRGELTEFRAQFPAYIKYKKISGEKIPLFKNFIGNQNEQYSNSLWKDADWLTKFDQELSKPIQKNGHHKQPESKAELGVSSHKNFMKNFNQ